MKKIQIICIALAMMCCFVTAGESALDVLITPSNGDPNSCLLNLTYSFQPKRVVFTVNQYIPDPINRSCTYQDIVTAPLFYNMPFTPLSLNLTPSAGNPNRLTARFTYAQMKSQLGSSCYLQWSNIQYTCKFKYANIFFYLDLWMNSTDNTTFDTAGGNTGVLFPELGSATQSTMYGKNIWVPNNTWPHIVGRITDGCGTWDNVVNSLSTPFTVTGTEYLSNTFDLYNYLSTAYEYRVLVLKNGAQPKTYKPVPTGHTPFDQPGTNNCSDTGLTYGDFLQNLTYCSNGCAISLGLYTSLQQFVLVTDGIATAPGRLRI